MSEKIALFCLISTLFVCSCGQNGNPPAPGFHAEASDPEAIRLADEVMTAMGGRKAWDDTRFLSWNFFGRRKLHWDKHTGQVRIDSYPDSTTYLLNMNTMDGRVKRRGVEEQNPDTLAMLLDRAKSIWINDSYWLVMPFKLKDSGVTLKYLGPGATADSRPADVLQLTFDNVGDTPENKYHVFVDQDSKLVTQWAYFRDASQTEPDFTTPWNDYRTYGKLLLSGDRGERQLTEIAVSDSLASALFTTFE